jgi:hypothetical protein
MADNSYVEETPDDLFDKAEKDLLNIEILNKSRPLKHIDKRRGIKYIVSYIKPDAGRLR